MNQLRQSCLVERAWALASASPGLHFWPPLSSCVNATPEWQLSSATAYPTLLHTKPIRHYVRMMSLKLHQHSSVSFWGKKGPWTPSRSWKGVTCPWTGIQVSPTWKCLTSIALLDITPVISPLSAFPSPRLQKENNTTLPHWFLCWS